MVLFSGIPLIRRENVCQFSSDVSYRVLISQYIVACASLAGYERLTSVIPPPVLSLIDIGVFIPTQPARDQGKMNDMNDNKIAVIMNILNEH